MIMTRLRYCVYDPDPRGNDRYYVRKPGCKKIRIREKFADAAGNITEEFMRAYRAALETPVETKVKKEPPREETFEWLVNRYYQSTEFRRLGKTTQREKRSILDRYCETAGRRPYRSMKKDDVEKSQLKRAATPGAADNLVKVLKALFNWAMAQSPPLMSHNPALKVKKINVSDGFHTWTREEIEQYRMHHALGTTPRLALEIMLNIGARISDAALIGPRHEANGVLRFTQQKNNGRRPKTIEIPMMKELREAVAASKIGPFTYLVTEYGAAFTKDGLGNRMREWCDAAKLPHCTAHGLRKASAVEHAESGTSAMEMCAIFGWDKLETAEVYIRAAQRNTLSRNGIARLEEHRRNKSVSLSPAEKPEETKREEK